VDEWFWMLVGVVFCGGLCSWLKVLDRCVVGHKGNSFFEIYMVAAGVLDAITVKGQCGFFFFYG
jgi:hypothetical protein